MEPVHLNTFKTYNSCRIYISLDYNIVKRHLEFKNSFVNIQDVN